MKRAPLACSLAAAAALALAVGGCTSDPAPAPATNTMTPAPAATNQPAASPSMSMPTMSGCPDKDATHVVQADTAVFTGIPGQGAVPVGILKAGTKVLSMVPGSEYSKCTIADGKTVYIKTAMLKPTTN